MRLPVQLVPQTHLQQYGWPFLLLISAAVIAGSDGSLELPEFYRTPLSEVIYQEQTSWRAKPEEDNGWRKGDQDLIQQGRLRKEILPDIDYEQRSDPTLENRFMDGTELGRPKTNLFRMKF